MGSLQERNPSLWVSTTEPGDVIELEIEQIGILRNTIGPRAQNAS